MNKNNHYAIFPGSQKRVSRLVQGTVSLPKDDIDEALAMLDGVYALGCTAFDTAHVYGTGYCERVLGEWMETRGLRDEVFILSKCAHPNQDRTRVNTFDITADLHDSLARLRTDSIDLYMLHRDDTAKPVGPIIETLNEHLEDGKIRAFGGSNWSTTRTAEANRYAAEHGLVGFSASSPQLSLAEPTSPPWEGCISVSGSAGKAERDWYAAQQMPLFTWSSLAAGFLTGRFTPETTGPFDFWLDDLVVAHYFSPENFGRLERAKNLAAQKGLSLPQLALAYVLNQPMPVFALVGHRSPREYEINLAAVGCDLSDQEMRWLEEGD